MTTACNKVIWQHWQQNQGAGVGTHGEPEQKAPGIPGNLSFKDWAVLPWRYCSRGEGSMGCHHFGELTAPPSCSMMAKVQSNIGMGMLVLTCNLRQSFLELREKISQSGKLSWHVHSVKSVDIGPPGTRVLPLTHSQNLVICVLVTTIWLPLFSSGKHKLLRHVGYKS